MTRRGAIAAGVLVLWLAGLAALTRRELGGGAAARLRAAGQRVSPGASYYALERDGAQIGFVSFTVDTTPTQVSVRTVVSAVAGSRAAGQMPFRVTGRMAALLTRSLRLQRFMVDLAPLGGRPRARGTLSGDTLLTLLVRTGAARWDTQRVAVSGPVYLPATAPLMIALGGEPAVGRSYGLTLFDPVALRAAPITLRVVAESLLAVSDSARRDARSGRWVSARTDTLRAWRIVQDSGGPLGGWVDEEGRFVDLALPGGLRLRRQAYEAAYLNWPDRALPSLPPRRP